MREKLQEMLKTYQEIILHARQINRVTLFAGVWDDWEGCTHFAVGLFSTTKTIHK